MDSKILDKLIDRSFEKRSMPLKEFLASENLDTYELGYIDILYADNLNNAIVPCRGYLILTRERWSDEYKGLVAEYALYSEHDNDNRPPLRNSLNMNATYKLEYVCDTQYENMAYAISYATKHIENMEKEDNK